MSSTHSLIALIKAEMKSAGLSYAALAQALSLSESSVKRMFAAGGEMPLSRVDEICRALNTDFAELSQKLLAQQPLRRELSLAQERAVVAEPKLLLMAICCLSQWSAEQILASYRLSEAEVTRYLAQLDSLGILELRPLNRYKLQVAKNVFAIPMGSRKCLFGMGCKARHAAHSRAMGKWRNAAGRPKRHLPCGLRRNRAICPPIPLHGLQPMLHGLGGQLIPIASQRDPIGIANTF
ncbi:helix-turn-helix domain-containing protein [Roseateles oligotrophus]|nr:helix-turn-helix transcriptional regulator [Roseateles oligotrophus]